MTVFRRPVLATPRSRGRTTETVLRGALVAVRASVVIGQDEGNRNIVLDLAGARPEWIDDLVSALWEARRAATQEVRP